MIIFESRDMSHISTMFDIRTLCNVLFQTPQMNIGSRACPIERNTLSGVALNRALPVASYREMS